MHTPQTMAAEVGRKVAMTRLGAGKKLSEVVKMSGITVAEVKDIEAGNFDYFENWPTDDNRDTHLALICKCLGIPMNTLPGGDDGVIY
jgi:hypothetical protein